MPFGLDDLASFEPIRTSFGLDDLADFNPVSRPRRRSRVEDMAAEAMADVAANWYNRPRKKDAQPSADELLRKQGLSAAPAGRMPEIIPGSESEVTATPYGLSTREAETPKIRYRPDPAKRASALEVLRLAEPPEAPRKTQRVPGTWTVQDLPEMPAQSFTSQTDGVAIGERPRDTNLERLTKLLSPGTGIGERLQADEPLGEAIRGGLGETAGAWSDVLFGNIDTGDTLLGRAADTLLTPQGQPGRFSAERGAAQEGGMLSPLADWLSGPKPEPVVGDPERRSVQTGRAPLVSLQSMTPERGFASGAAQFTEGLALDPEGGLLLAGTGGLGALRAAGAGAVPRAVSGYFAYDMGKATLQHSADALDAFAADDMGRFRENLALLLGSGVFAAQAGKHAAKGSPSRVDAARQGVERVKAELEAIQKESPDLSPKVQRYRQALDEQLAELQRAETERAIHGRMTPIEARVPEFDLPGDVPRMRDNVEFQLERAGDPARVAALREALRREGGNPDFIEPLVRPDVQRTAERTAQDRLASEVTGGERGYLDLTPAERAVVDASVRTGEGFAAEPYIHNISRLDPAKMRMGDLRDIITPELERIAKLDALRVDDVDIKAAAQAELDRRMAEATEAVTPRRPFGERVAEIAEPAEQARMSRVLENFYNRKYADIQPEAPRYEVPQTVQGITRLLEIETNPAKRAALQDALRERGFDPTNVGPQRMPALGDPAVQEALRRAAQPRAEDYQSEAGQRRLAALEELANRWSDGERGYMELPREERRMIEEWVDQGFGQSAGGELPWKTYPPQREAPRNLIDEIVIPERTFTPEEIYRQAATGDWIDGAPVEVLVPAQRLHRAGALWGPEDVAKLQERIGQLPRDADFEMGVDAVVRQMRLEKLGEMPKDPATRYEPAEVIEDLGLTGAKISRQDRSAIAQLGQERLAQAMGLDVRNLTTEEAMFIRDEARKLGYGQAIRLLPTTAKPKPATPAPAPQPETPAAPAVDPRQPALTPAPPAAPTGLHWNLRPRDPKAPPNVGHRSTAYSTQKMQPVEFEWVLEDVRDTVNSWDKNQPEQYQNRDTNTRGSRRRIEEIKAWPVVQVLADSPFISDGAPMTLDLGQQRVTLFGNHRDQAIREIHERGGAKSQQIRDAYRQMAPSFGIDPALVDSIEMPILRRRIKGQYSEKQLLDLVKEANERTTTEIDPTQQAKNDAARLTPEMMALFRPDIGADPLRSPANREFVERFLSEIVPPSELDAMLGRKSGKGINDAGKQRIEAAIHFRAYEDPLSLEWKAESAPEGTRNMAKALDAAAPRWADMRARMEAGERWQELDIAKDVSEAASTLALLRNEGIPLEEALAQGSLPIIGNADLKNQIIRTLDEFRRSPARLAAIMERYADWVDSNGRPIRENMFGPVEPPSAIEGWKIARESVVREMKAEAEAQLAKRGGKDAAGTERADARPDTRRDVGDRGEQPAAERGGTAEAGTVRALEETARSAEGDTGRPAAEGSGDQLGLMSVGPPKSAAEGFTGTLAERPELVESAGSRRAGQVVFLNDVSSHIFKTLNSYGNPASKPFNSVMAKVNGVAIEPASIREAVGLVERWLTMEREGRGDLPITDAGVRAVESVLRDLREASGNFERPVGIVFNRKPNVARHESIHVEQYSVGLNPVTTPTEWLRNDVYGHKALEGLRKARPGYFSNPIADTPQRHAMEVVAHLGAGQYDLLGMTKAEAVQALAAFFREVQQQRKVTPVRMLETMKQDMRRELYEQLGRIDRGSDQRTTGEVGRSGEPDGSVRGVAEGRGVRPDGETRRVEAEQRITDALRDPESAGNRAPGLSGIAGVIAPPSSPTPGAFERASKRSEQALNEMMDGNTLNANPIAAAYHMAMVGLGQTARVFRSQPDINREALRTRLKEQWVDDAQMLKELARLAKLPSAEDPYVLARLSKGREARIILRMNDLAKIIRPLYTNKIIDPTTNKPARLYDAAIEHMKLKRYEELAQRTGPEAITQFEGDIQAADIPRLLRQNEQKLGGQLSLVKSVEQQLYRFSDELMQLSRDAGILSDAQYQQMKARNQSYIPLQRLAFLAEHVDTMVRGSSVFSVSKQDIYRSIKGSEKEVADPIQSITRNIVRTINLVERNKVARSVADLAGRPEYEGIIQKLGDSNKPAKDVPNHAPEGFDVFHAIIDGKVEKFAAPAPVVEMMKRLKSTQETNVLLRMIATSSGWLRAGATTLYLPFVVSNAVMDVWRASTQARLGFNPITDYIPGLTEAVKMQFGKSRLADRMSEAGGMMSGFQESLRRAPENIADLAYPEGQPLGKKAKRVVINSTIGLVGKLAEISEMSTRLGVARKALKRGATDMEAAFDMRNATVDFNKAGTAGRVANLVIPFLNARIQGTANIATSFRDRPMQTLVRGVSTLTFPAMMAYLWNTTMYPEIYDEIEDYEKDNAIPIIWGKEIVNKDGSREVAHEILMIPMGEMGALFWKPAEEMLQAERGRDHRDFLETATYLASTFFPLGFEREGKFAADRLIGSISPPPIRAALEGTFNQNTFTGRTLVPRGMEGADPEEQYRSKTAPLAVAMGQFLADRFGEGEGISPIKIENAAGTMFGGVGRAIMDASRTDTSKGVGSGILSALGRMAEGGSSRFIGADLKRADADKQEDYAEASRDANTARVIDSRNADIILEQLKGASPDERRQALGKAMADGIINDRTLNYIVDRWKRDARDIGWLHEQLSRAPVDLRARYLLNRYDHVGKQGLLDEIRVVDKLKGQPVMVPWLTPDVMQTFAQMLAERKRQNNEGAKPKPRALPLNPARPEA